MINPDNFFNDPLGHAGNQSGHARIGAGAALVGLVIYPGGGEAVALVAALFYLWIVEGWFQGYGMFWDSIEDACHVCFGALGVVLLHYFGPLAALGCFVAWALVLSFGMWRRWT